MLLMLMGFTALQNRRAIVSYWRKNVHSVLVTGFEKVDACPGNVCLDFTLVVVSTILTGNTECLHCFHCKNITKGVDCDHVSECQYDESCYVQRSRYDNSTLYTMGCMERQRCPEEHQFTLVGRSVSNDHCQRCCSQNGCNKRYCELEMPTASPTTPGLCTDVPGHNCAELEAIAQICATPRRAKDICRHYCKLCDMVDGAWSQWNKWSLCSATCDLGTRTRNRQCTDPAPAHGGYNCSGNSTQIQSCFPRACPIHGGWSPWEPWERCSVSCDTGLKKRHRTCTDPPPSLYGHYCIGDPVEYDLCQEGNCGNQSTPNISNSTNSTNTCVDVLSNCANLNSTIHICSKFEDARKTCPYFCRLCGIVDGSWSAWSDWNTCSVTCGNGTASRKRTCDNPPPQQGGNNCSGNSTESNVCTIRPCPVHGGWSVWSGWEPCSSTCGQGITRRTRVCDNPRPALLGNFCFGDSTEYGICLAKPCPVDGGWTNWLHWSACSVTCGQGNKTRERLCLNPAPTNGGRNCTGLDIETGTCNLTLCQAKPLAVDGGWTNWLHWSACSVTCGQGNKTRERLCLNPAPANGRRNCTGLDIETDACNLATCQVKPLAVDGGWTNWQHWSACSVTCGQGQNTRERLCLNPAPASGGRNCTGQDTEHSVCNLTRCPEKTVDGVWTNWLHWSACSVTCGQGQRTRERLCLNPAPTNGGRNCTGQEIEHGVCNLTRCPEKPDIKSAFTVFWPRAGPSNDTITFNNVVTNIGGDFNTTTGQFVCKYSGIYFFALHIMKKRQSNSAYCWIRKNEVTVIEVYSDPDTSADPGFDGVSNTAVLHLVPGDIVDLGGCSGIDSFAQSWETSFSGFLLRAD